MSEHETPAETIRRAIEQMRNDVDARWEAAADLLAHTLTADHHSRLQLGHGIAAGRMEHAIRLARTYLGETP